MKKITFNVFFLLSALTWYSQAQIVEGFEVDPPPGWTFMQTEDDDPGFVQTDSQANSGTFSFYKNDDNLAVESTAWMISPAYTVSMGDLLKFYYRHNFSNIAGVENGVYISSASADPIANPDDFTLLYDLLGNASEDAWTLYSQSMDAYNEQTVYIAFKYVGDFEDELYIDDFYLGEAPDCEFTEPTFTVDTGCPSPDGTFSVTVDISDIGTGTGVSISDDQETSPQTGLTAGSYTFGDYADGTEVVITVSNDDDPTVCFYESAVLTFSGVCPPANDDCDGAIELVVNATSECTEETSGTNVGATPSAQQDDVTGNPNTDVWYSFVATAETHTITLSNVEYVSGGSFSSVDMGMGVYDASSGCDALVLVDDSDPNSFDVGGLTIGGNYVLRVYNWSNTVYFNTFDICISTPPAAPDNDECDNATALTVSTGNSCDNAVSGTTQSASITDDVACSNSGRDVWYSFTPASDGEYDFSVTETFESASFTTTYITIYEGGCDALTALTSSCFNTSEVTFDLTSGETYYVNIRSSSSSNYTEFDVCVGTPPTDTLDYYNLQSPLSGEITTGDEFNVYAQAYEAGVTDASDEPVEGIEAWIGYSETDSNPNTTADWTWVAAAPNDGYDFAQNNDEYFLNLGAEIDSEGTYYYASRFRYNGGPFTYGGIQDADPNPFGGAWGTDGNGSGVLTITAPPAPANDDACNAIQLNVGDATTTAPYSNVSATTQADEVAGSCHFFGDTAAATVWFKFIAPDGGSVTISTDQISDTATLNDTQLTLFTVEDCSDLSSGVVEVGCDEDGGESLLSTIVATDLTPGEEYYIVVDGYDSSTGSFDLSLTDDTLSLNSFEELGFSYFPNPMKEQLHLKAQMQIENVVIFNMLGQEVINVSPKALDVEVNTSSLQNGAYFATITIGNTSKTIKLIKD